MENIVYYLAINPLVIHPNLQNKSYGKSILKFIFGYLDQHVDM